MLQKAKSIRLVINPLFSSKTTSSSIKTKPRQMVRYSFLTMMFLEMGKLTWKTYSGIIYGEMEISEVQKSRISATKQTSL